MKRTYLIDSENINDVWVEILDALEIGDCIMVFFTDKSAHMGYDRIVRLMELEKGTVKWIRCFGGQNALDFQLVTELGHQICQDQECEYVIVSNDTGYDSVVRYWQQRGCSVSRIKGMECTKLASRMKKQRQEEPCISIFLKKKTFGEVTPEAVNSEVVSSENSEKAVSEKIVSEQSDFGKLTSENEISGDVVSQQEKTAQTIEAIDAADPVKTAGTANSGAETKVQIDNDASETVQKNAVADFVKDIVDEAKKSVSASVEIGNEEKSENLESESDACDGTESERPNRRRRRRGKSSAVLAKTLFDKVATPERKAQVESLTDTAKTALGAVLETASEMIAEQIAEKNSEKNSEKNTEKNAEKNAGKKTEKKVEKSAEKSVEENTQKAEKKTEKNAGKSAERHTEKLAETKSEPAPECAVTKPDSEETLKKTENKTEESVIEYPELEDERDLNYDPDEDQDEDSEDRKNAENLENAKNPENAEKQGESEASEETEAQRMASYTPCQRSILRIFRASGSTDPHQDLKFFMDICGTVKLSNMSMVHNMLEYQFGQAVGNSLYRYLKENPECKEELSAGYSNRRKQREREYLDLILKRNQIEIQEEATETIWKILSGLPRKNLSGIHTALVKKFGQEIGSGYYAVLRNHVKIIRNL